MLFAFLKVTCNIANNTIPSYTKFIHTVSQLSDVQSIVRATAIHVLTGIVRMVNEVSLSNAAIFQV